MNTVKYISLLLLIFSFILPANSQDVFRGKVDKLAKKYVKKRKNKSLVIGIIQDGNCYIKGYGKLSKENPVLPTAETIYEIGGLSAVFPAVLMVQLSEEGVIDMTSSIQDNLPKLLQVPAFQPQICTEVVVDFSNDDSHMYFRPLRTMSCRDDPLSVEVYPTICNLATHSSGLPNRLNKRQYAWHPFYSMNYRKETVNDWTKDQLYYRLEAIRLNNYPGHSYDFSTTGIALLGHLLSDASGLSYGELLKEKITKPLHMEQTLLLLDSGHRAKKAPGHTRKGKPVNNWEFDALAPAVGLKSNASDLTSFLLANLNTKDQYWKNIFEQVHQSRVGIKRQKLGRPSWGTYGWVSSTLNKKSNLPLVWMNGGTGGYRSFMGLLKDAQIGIVILSNSATDVDEMGFEMLEALVAEKTKAAVIATTEILKY